MPKPTMNSPISANTKLLADKMNIIPNKAHPKHISSVNLLPIWSTIEPNIIKPTNDPKKNIPIAVDTIYDF